jgi:hypothetical protein
LGTENNRSTKENAMIEFATRNMGNGVRVQWVMDEDYQTDGSYALDTEEETQEAEAWESGKLESGDLVALGAIVEKRCPHCESWREIDSLWGIVIEPNGEKLDEFARWGLDLGGR